jgi:hypothetical protein
MLHMNQNYHPARRSTVKPRRARAMMKSVARWCELVTRRFPAVFCRLRTGIKTTTHMGAREGVRWQSSRDIQKFHAHGEMVSARRLKCFPCIPNFFFVSRGGTSKSAIWVVVFILRRGAAENPPNLGETGRRHFLRRKIFRAPGEAGTWLELVVN